jgi:hypothetical protein
MTNRKCRVLVFPAGSEIGLEIFNSLKYSHHVELFGASGKNDHAAYVYDKEHYVEGDFFVDRPDFISRFNQLLRSLGIEYIFPTHDTICCFLAEHQSELGAQVLTSCFETNRIARSKRLTYDLFKSQKFCPRVFSDPLRDISFPVFLKPDDGQGGKGTYVANDSHELGFYLRKNPELLTVEFLPGAELSVDCFTDYNGKLLFVGPRTRERVQMGISFRSTTLALSKEIELIAHCINNKVSLNGAWFFQVKKDSQGCFKILEFAPRQSSTMGLYRNVGVNFALLSLFNGMRLNVEILQNQYAVQLDRCLHNRFRAELTYSRVYLDFDETLAVGRHVNANAIAFVYQCRNRNIPIVLLTKHRYNLSETLRNCGISEYLFEKIIQLDEWQNKCDFINPDDAIFIDNYWFDRRAVKMRFGIPVFDVDAIESLIT